MKRVRNRIGVDVEYKGATYRVVTEAVSGANVGVEYIQTQLKMLGAYGASADPRVFVFNPQDFQPTTDILAPIEGDELTWNGLTYRITRAAPDDVRDETVDWLCYGYRMVI